MTNLRRRKTNGKVQVAGNLVRLGQFDNPAAPRPRNLSHKLLITKIQYFFFFFPFNSFNSLIFDVSTVSRALNIRKIKKLIIRY